MKKGLFLLLALLSAMLGCRVLPPAPPEPELTADQILSRLRSGRGNLATFAAAGRLTLISPQQNATGTALVKGIAPETLRVDLKDPLGRTVLSFFTDGRVVEVLFPREGKLFQGPATPTNLASFVPPQVKLSHAVRLLTGDLPLSPGAPQGNHLEAGGERLYVLEWRQSNGSPQERLWVSASDFQPRKVEWFGPDGTPAFRAELEESQAGPRRPGQLKLETSTPRMELRLAYRDFTPNPPLSPLDLAVPRPPGVAVLPLKP